MTQANFILTLSCPDQMGIVHAVSGFLFERGGNIVDSAQFDDQDSDRFFMRVHFEEHRPDVTLDVLKAEFAPIAEKYNMDWQLFDGRVKPRLLIMVSKIGHCLNDLLFRHQSGNLPIDIAAVVSNHPDYAPLAASYGVPFHHFPLLGSTDAQKAEQEAQVLNIVATEQIDCVILARYMQILSDNMCQQLNGRAINIHHSFLPSFKGAKPYHQAFNKGVKLIGATAHFVTADLDEGPIIEQDIARVNHAMSAAELTAMGRDVECVTLARAVKWHAERRVVLNGKKTVVFR